MLQSIGNFLAGGSSYYLFIAIVGSTILVLQFIMSMAGLGNTDTPDADFSVDAHDLAARDDAHEVDAVRLGKHRPHGDPSERRARVGRKIVGLAPDGRAVKIKDPVRFHGRHRDAVGRTGRIHGGKHRMLDAGENHPAVALREKPVLTTHGTFRRAL